MKDKKKKLFVSLDADRRITAISSHPFEVVGEKSKHIEMTNPLDLIGARISGKYLGREDFVTKPSSDLRIAFICNWNTKCGISTYSKYLLDALTPMVKEIRIFSEHAITKTAEDADNVERCWKRGEPLVDLANKVLDWTPDFIIIQHEFGIFPNAFHFMQLMQAFENTPYAVTMHSIYDHLDKAVYTECVKNVVVHSAQAKERYFQNGNTGKCYVVPHGCFVFPDAQELWNICQNPYTVMQFGFGFAYKGVERALDAIHHLKTSDKKFENIYYFYLISDNDYNSNAHLEYYNRLKKKVKELGLTNNVAFVRKYQTDYMLNMYLRLAKLAIFPYVNNPNNTVYAASGAVRIAMANKVPVIASESHLFDDLEGVLPRPSSHIDLAKAIDDVFSNWKHRDQIVRNAQEFLKNNTWEHAADQYLSVYQQITAI